MLEMKFQVPPTIKEISDARGEELKNLTDFEAYEWWPIDQTSHGKWIKSRWEETHKDNGTYRSRWVLQEFANKKLRATSSQLPGCVRDTLCAHQSLD